MIAVIKHTIQRLDRRVLYTFFFCAGIVLIGYFLISDRNPNHRNLTVVSVSEKTGNLSIEAEYPQFSGLSGSFNSKIEHSVLAQIAEFKKNVSELSQNTHGDKKDTSDKFIFRASWSPDQLSDSMVSILLREYSYVGGAHGIHTTETYTFDVKKKKEVTLADVFSGTPGYLERISQYAMNDIKSQLGSEAVMDMIREGTTPNENNFAVFTLSRDNMITFYFPEYQVAPYASGEQRVTMPISFIKAQSE